MTTTTDQRVCPRCGEPAGEQRFCGSCGLNIWEQRELPAREEWERSHLDPLDTEPFQSTPLPRRVMEEPGDVTQPTPDEGVGNSDQSKRTVFLDIEWRELKAAGGPEQIDPAVVEARRAEVGPFYRLMAERHGISFDELSQCTRQASARLAENELDQTPRQTIERIALQIADRQRRVRRVAIFSGDMIGSLVVIGFFGVVGFVSATVLHVSLAVWIALIALWVLGSAWAAARRNT